LGAKDLTNMVINQVMLARYIAEFIREHPKYELLPLKESGAQPEIKDIGIIVLFRAKDNAVNLVLVDNINASKKIYVGGTVWDGRPAVRVAVSTWKADAERDVEIIKAVLEKAASPGKHA
jgi:hypothetical protein